MKKFQFKLEPLFKYKKYQERIAQQKTAKAHLDVKDCEQQIADLRQAWDTQRQTMETAAQKGVSAALFQQHYQYLSSVGGSIVQEQKRKIDLDKVLDEKLLQLKKKSMDKRAMEVYRDKMKARYVEEAIQIEQKELDEISTLKTARMTAQ